MKEEQVNIKKALAISAMVLVASNIGSVAFHPKSVTKIKQVTAVNEVSPYFAPATTTTIPKPKPTTTTTTLAPTTTTPQTTVPQTVQTYPPVTQPAPAQTGDPVPWCIVWRESRGDWTAQNPSSTASGRYQILDTTWMATSAGASSGYTHAASAPPSVQEAVAAELVATQGLAPWGGGC